MLYSLKKKQFLPIDLNSAWDFFSNPHNLKVITPDYMQFNILSDLKSGEFYPGMIIEYRIRPVANIPIYWATEISQIIDKQLFVDEQRFGIYSFWHHKHLFKEVVGGTEMEDIVHYKLPLGFIGKIAHSLFVKKQLEAIFTYRENKLKELFYP